MVKSIAAGTIEDSTRVAGPWGSIGSNGDWSSLGFVASSIPSSVWVAGLGINTMFSLSLDVSEGSGHKSTIASRAAGVTVYQLLLRAIREFSIDDGLLSL